jgi:hypothetical protein
MNGIGRVHRALARLAPSVAIDVLATDDVEAAIRRCAESTRARRRSPLDPVLIVWLCLAMALWRADSIPNVFARLVARARGRRTWVGLRPVTDGALAHARERLGAAPLRSLFEAVARACVPAPAFHGRRVYTLDGTVLSVPDTPANAQAFGRHRASTGTTAFPSMRALALTSTTTREVRAASFSPYATSEMASVPSVLDALGPGDLVLLDRGFMGAWLFAAIRERGADYVCRVRSSVKPRLLRRRGPGDSDVEFRGHRPEDRQTGRRRVSIVTRLVEYRVAGGTPVRLLTSLGGEDISAREIAELYHERWEAETTLDEVKTHLAAPRHGTLALPFRGRTPALAEQEFWATLAAYNLVRRLIDGAARVHRIPARRISFTDALAVVTSTWTCKRLEGEALVRAYVVLCHDLADCVLERWRRPRVCPRKVRRRTARYPAKKPHDRERVPSLTLTLGLSRRA